MSRKNRAVDRRIRDALKEAGFQFERNTGNGGHFIYKYPVNGRKISISGSPTNLDRAVKSVLAEIRRILRSA